MNADQTQMYLEGLAKFLHKNISEIQQKISQKILNCGDPLYLVKGDLSGIQNYLYNVNRAEDIDGSVMKRLRGRSFYVSAFCQAFADEIARLLGNSSAPEENILLAAGGKFMVILPDSENIRERLHQWKAEVDQWFWEQSWGEIFLNLAYSKCSRTELQSNFNRIALDLQGELDIGKSRKFQTIFSNSVQIPSQGNIFRYPVFTELSPHLFLEECHSCQSLPAPGEKALFSSTEHLCEPCTEHQEIGKKTKLPDHNYLKFYPKPVTPGLSAEDYVEFRTNYALLCEYAEDVPRIAGFVPEFPYQWLKERGINDNSPETKESELCEGCSLSNPEECQNDRLPTRLHCLATLAHKEGGAAKIAVLAIDGDDFSFHFNSSVGITLIDHVTAGELIYCFFADHLVDILRQNDCLLVYSGGDDLVIVGPWMNVYEVAEKLYNDFLEATAGILHFSAGLYVAAPQEPIYESIGHAQKYLEKAKNQKSKNAIHLMSTFVPWDRFAAVLQLAKDLEQAVREEIITRGFIYNLYKICEREEKFRNEGDISGLQYIGWLAAHLRRNLRLGKIEDPRRREIAKLLRDKLTSLLVPSQDTLLPYLRASLDWAVLKCREL